MSDDEKTVPTLRLGDDGDAGCIGFELDEDGGVTLYFDHESDAFDASVVTNSDGDVKQVRIALSEEEASWLIERIAEERGRL